MTLFKKCILAVLLGFAMLVAPFTAAVAEEEISQESVIKALDEAISTSEEIVTALQSGGDADSIEAMYKKVKYAVKAVVISDSKSAVPRSKANKRMNASRKAFRKGEIEKAVSLATEGVKYYKQTKANKI